MTIQDIEKNIEHLKQISGDDEAAHSYEDSMREGFLEFVATSTIEPYAGMARLLLTTNNIDFNRWCA